MSIEENVTSIGANGVVIETTLNEDLTDVTLARYKVKKPKSGDIVYWTCTIDDYANGVVSYKSVAADLDEVGIYKLRVMLTYTNNDEIPAKMRDFEVEDEFPS